MGLAVSIVGFLLTLIGVHRSKKAAQQAKEAAESARRDIFRSNAMIELSAVTTTMQEIKRLQRDGEWAGLLDRYSSLRASLIAIRASKPSLDANHQAVIQSAITQIRAIEHKVERALSAGEQPSSAKLNDIISRELDQISDVLGVLRSNQNG